MKEASFRVEFDKYDMSIMLSALGALRSQQISEKRPTDPIDDLIIKVSKAPLKKQKMKTSDYREER